MGLWLNKWNNINPLHQKTKNHNLLSSTLLTYKLKFFCEHVINNWSSFSCNLTSVAHESKWFSRVHMFSLKVSVSFSSMRKPSCLSNTHIHIYRGSFLLHRAGAEGEEEWGGKRTGWGKSGRGEVQECRSPGIVFGYGTTGESRRERGGREDWVCWEVERLSEGGVTHLLSHRRRISSVCVDRNCWPKPLSWNTLKDWFTDWTLVQLEDWTTCCLIWHQIFIISNLDWKTDQVIGSLINWLTYLWPDWKVLLLWFTSWLIWHSIGWVWLGILIN